MVRCYAAPAIGVLGKAGIDMVSAWATANHLVLGQVKVDDKSNEITAIPKLLQVLEIAGCIVTIDAMGCQTEIAQAIVDLDADYVLAVKENQGHLYEDVKGLFDAAQELNFKDVPHDYCKTTDKGHGRLEIRQCWTISDAALVNYLRNRAGWRNLRTIVKVVAERRVNGETSHRRSLLHLQPGWRCPAHAKSGTQPLGHRKLAALGAGHRLR